MKIRRALISVSDKTGVAVFAHALEGQGVDIISTGGTAVLLRKEKIPVREISSFTAFPEVLDGRVKTLHPRVHGGLLSKRGEELRIGDGRRRSERLRHGARKHAQARWGNDAETARTPCHQSL